MKIAFLTILAIHALIHLLGFAKAFDMAEIKQLSQTISKSYGLLWLLSFLLLTATLVFNILHYDYWWVAGLLGVLLSQLLIINSWQDAKFGSIANLLILLLALWGFMSWKFENNYREDVREGMERTSRLQNDLLTESDLKHLPDLVQNYLRYTGSLNRPKVKNVQMIFDAEMRAEEQAWFDMDVEQHNFFDTYERLFFLKATVRGMPTTGYHLYKEGEARMNIKLLSVFPVAQHSGEEMFKSETVTLLNDMCFFAPATLIAKNISWKTIDSHSVEARFTNRGTTVSAILHFNEAGQLINFVSNDRYDMNRKQQFRFSTPVSNYREINGYLLPSYGEAIWHYPEGAFTYGKFKLLDIAYNLSPES